MEPESTVSETRSEIVTWQPPPQETAADLHLLSGQQQPTPVAPPETDDAIETELRLLSDQQRLLNKQMSTTRESVGQVFTALEMMVGALSEVMTRIKTVPSSATTEQIEPILETISTEVKALRTYVESKPDPQPPNLRELTVPLTAAFERLDRRTAEHIDKTVSDRMQGLYEALREDFEQQNQQRDRIMRREIDRLLFLALGIAGLLTGGGLWLLLKP